MTRRDDSLEAFSGSALPSALALDDFESDDLDRLSPEVPSDATDEVAERSDLEGPTPWGGSAETIDAAEERTLISAAKRGDVHARDRLVRLNYRAITWVARRYRGSGVPLDDLVNEGAIGVLTAVERFDIDRGTRFETYARWWILDAMRTCVMRQSRTVRLPANVVKEIGQVDRLMKVDDSVREDSRPHGSVIKHVARRMRRSGEHVEHLLALREPALPIDGVDHLSDLPSDDRASNLGQWSPEASAAVRQMVHRLTHLMEAMTPRHRAVLMARYGLEDGEPRSLEQIGVELGLTAERVRQIQNEALRVMRARFAEAGLMPPVR